MNPADFFVPVILGTGRKDRASENVAQFIFEQVQEHGFRTELVDVRSMAIDATIASWVDDSRADDWRKLAGESDGFLIIVPEYNHGYPGELKMLIDRAKNEYRHKPVATCGVSSGGFGGARAVEALLPVYLTLEMVPIKEAVFFSNVGDLFNDAGEIQDGSFAERVTPMLDSLLWYADTLKQGRDKD